MLPDTSHQKPLSIITITTKREPRNSQKFTNKFEKEINPKYPTPFKATSQYTIIMIIIMGLRFVSASKDVIGDPCTKHI